MGEKNGILGGKKLSKDTIEAVSHMKWSISFYYMGRIVQIINFLERLICFGSLKAESQHFSLFCLFLLFFGLAAWFVGSYLSNQGLNPCTLQWKSGSSEAWLLDCQVIPKSNFIYDICCFVSYIEHIPPSSSFQSLTSCHFILHLNIFTNLTIKFMIWKTNK